MKRQLLLLLTIVSLGAKTFAQSQEQGIKQMTEENYQSATKIFKKLIADEPAKGENYYYIGDCYLSLNKQDSAKQYFDMGIQADPKSPFCYVGTGEWYLNQNDVANAKKYFDEATDNSPNKDTKTLVAIAQAYANSDHNNYEEAINNLTKAQTINAKDADIYVALGDIYYAENDGGHAVDNYDHAIDLGKDVAKCDTREGVIWTHALQYNQALPKFEDALKTDSSFAPAYSGLAELYYLTRQYQRAKDTYAKFLALADKNDYTKYRYVQFLYVCNDYATAITQIKDLAKRDTSNAIMYRLLGYSYYHTNNYPDAITALNTYFRKVNPKKIIDSDYIYYARSQSKDNLDSLAVITYTKAIAIDTADCSLRSELADMLYKDKKYANAVGAWKSDIKCLQDKAGLAEYFKLGLSYYYSNQFGKADSTFKYAEKYNATWIQLPLFRARSEARIDTDMTLGTANALYDSALVLALKDSVHNIQPLTEIYLYDGYYVLQIQKDFKKSVEYFNKVLALDPNNASAKEAIDEIDKTLKAAKVPQQQNPTSKQNR